MTPIFMRDPLVQELVKLLKLPRGTQSFKLSAAVGDVVTVECTYIAEAPESVASLQALGAGYKARLPEAEPVTAVVPVDVMSEVRRSAEGSSSR